MNFTSLQNTTWDLPSPNKGPGILLKALYVRYQRYFKRVLAKFSNIFHILCLLFFLKFINKSGFRICVKELVMRRLDTLNVSYAVLLGTQMKYFG